MPTYKLTIAYDGTDFAGWQKQEPPDPEGQKRPQRVALRKLDAGLEAGKPGRIALRTVQAVVERAVREVVREPVVLRGASRTDAGVHARCQVGVFACSGGESDEATERRSDEGGLHGSESRATGGWPVERGVDRLLRAVNSRLPGDVQVVAAEVVEPGFDPIGDCVAKGYSYSFWVSGHRPLWERRTVWHTWAYLDVGAMQEAAACLVGEHDFAAFAAAGHGRLSTVREVFACEVVEVVPSASERLSVGEGVGQEPSPQPSPRGRGSMKAVAEPGRLVRMEISGNGFLYNMVRIVAGTLHDVGRGRIAPGDVAGIIAGLDRRRAGPTLPPEGLCLEWIRYAER